MFFFIFCVLSSISLYFLIFPPFPLSFLQYEEEGVPCIFDCKWSPDGLTCAAADSFGYMTIFGFGSSTPYEQVRQWVWPLRNNKPVILIMILAWTLFQNIHVHVSYFLAKFNYFMVYW